MVSFIPKHNLYHPVYCPESGHLKSFWHWESGGFWEAVVNASLWHSCCLAALGGALWGDRPPRVGTRTALQKWLLLPGVRQALGDGERFLNLIKPLTANSFCWSQ